MPVMLEQKLIDLIEEKAVKECPKTALLYSSTYIGQLNDHIAGRCSLSTIEIEEKIDYLVGCLTITLDLPCNDLEFLRARRCEGKRFDQVDDLSYIKNPKKHFPKFPKQGRLNQAGEALFYASLAIRKDDTALEVVLSEAGARDLDHLNVLRSHQKRECYLNMAVIDIWDQVRRGYKPYYIADDTFDYYKEALELMKKKFSPDLLNLLNLLKAYQLTDRFLDDILSRKGSVNLYQVTSAIGSFILEDSSIDGILYSSVEAKGEPVVALKRSAVDKKLQHQFVGHIRVVKRFGYEFYEYENLGKTVKIDISGKLYW